MKIQKLCLLIIAGIGTLTQARGSDCLSSGAGARFYCANDDYGYPSNATVEVVQAVDEPEQFPQAEVEEVVNQDASVESSEPPSNRDDPDEVEISPPSQTVSTLEHGKVLDGLQATDLPTSDGSQVKSQPSKKNSNLRISINSGPTATPVEIFVDDDLSIQINAR